ncbi:nucleoside deaminase [Saccharicrinis sp. FJH54]|uniref:nucleoside deaminase n=1 Tax=Saccharicrinis sp. FJH54 TaxID=3344665 RepID=UPI0035D3FE6D
MNKTDERFMQRAIQKAKEGMDANAGGPFGCVIVKDGEIIAESHNRVTSANDPTAHAEIVAIREACRKLNTYQLEGCKIYTSCEPCPMCMGAIYWARPDVVYYAASKTDAAKIGFDDGFIYDEFSKPISKRKIRFIKILPEAARSLFEQWTTKTDKTKY